MRYLRYAIAAVTCSALSCATAKLNPDESVSYLYHSISFDIAYVGTAEPDHGALDKFREALAYERICSVSSTHFSFRRAELMDTMRVWDISIASSFECVNRGKSSPTSRCEDLSVFVAYVPGTWLPPTEPGYVTCGYTYKAASFIVLVDSFDRSKEEVALLLHEFGHILDLDGELHCSNENCLMFKHVRQNGARYCPECRERINKLRNRHAGQPELY